MTATDTNEKLSAFVDGELEGRTRDRIVDALYENPDLRRKWERFHLIGDAVRGTGPVPGAAAIAENVSAALSTETVVRLGPRRRRSMLRPLAGLAMAAAIAGVAVVGIHRLDGGGGEPSRVAEAPRAEPAPAGSAPAAREPSEVRVATASNRSAGAGTSRLQWSDVAPDAEARLNAYLVSHNEYAGTGMGGVLPYVRIVGYQSFEGDER